MAAENLDSLTPQQAEMNGILDKLSSLATIDNILLLVVAVLFAVSIIYLMRQKKTMSQDEFRSQNKKKSINIYGLCAHYSSKFFLTRRKYFRTREQVVNLYPADDLTIENETGRILLLSYCWFVSCVLFAIVMIGVAGFDLFYGAACLFTGLVLMNLTTNSQIRKIRYELLLGEQATFQNIRHLYHADSRITIALNKAIGLASPIMAPHLADIYEIISSPDMMEKAEEYASKHGDKYLSMFLAICTAIKENGDTTMPDGSSLFLTTLGYIKEQVDSDIIAENRKKIGFKGVIFVTLIPLILVKPLEWWAVGNMPTISQYYSGIYSTVAVMFTFVATYLIYIYLEMLMTDEDKMMQTENIYSKLAQHEPFSSVCNRLVNQKYTYYLGIDSSLRAMGDHTGVKAFLVKRFVYAVIGFAMGLVVTIGGTYVGKSGLLDDFTEEFDSISTITPDYKESMYAIAADMMKEHLKDEISEEELTAQIKQNYQMTTAMASQVAISVLEHKADYLDRYYRWWYLVVSLLMGVLASYIPLIIIKSSSKIIEAKRSEEVMQYQTLMMIIMHIPGTTVSKVLEWLERYASIFLEDIITARASLGSGKEAALTEMRDSESFEPFRQFCDNLLAVDKSGIESAFGELTADHSYFMRDKEQNRNASIDGKVSRARMLCMGPMWIVMIFYLLIPLTRYALEMFSMFSTATQF